MEGEGRGEKAPEREKKTRFFFPASPPLPPEKMCVIFDTWPKWSVSHYFKGHLFMTRTLFVSAVVTPAGRKGCCFKMASLGKEKKKKIERFLEEDEFLKPCRLFFPPPPPSSVDKGKRA